jgi:NTP pyrophosphatase (non-canonical NTP hydrolase)
MEESMNIEDALRTEAPLTEGLLERYNNCCRDLHAVLGKLTELGEIADQYKRHIFYGTPLDSVNVKEELGDGYWYDSLLLNIHGATFEECFTMMVNKLKARYPEKFNELDAVERNLSKERAILENS